jgi:hypothetical protein
MHFFINFAKYTQQFIHFETFETKFPTFLLVCNIPKIIKHFTQIN